MKCPECGGDGIARANKQWECGKCGTKWISAEYCAHCDREVIAREIVDALWRPALRDFACAMEAKLRKNDHKTSWRDQPIEALFRLLMLAVEEFKVADEFFSVANARNELVDIANFALILYDRLGMIDQDRTRHEQQTK